MKIHISWNKWNRGRQTFFFAVLSQNRLQPEKIRDFKEWNIWKALLFPEIIEKKRINMGESDSKKYLEETSDKMMGTMYRRGPALVRQNLSSWRVSVTTIVIIYVLLSKHFSACLLSLKMISSRV